MTIRVWRHLFIGFSMKRTIIKLAIEEVKRTKKEKIVYKKNHKLKK